MWKRTKNSGFSLVHRYIQHFNEVSGNKTVVIRKKSKTPGVMITQYDTTIPEGKSTPDIVHKPVSLALQEGKVAVFKAVVKGDPAPEVTWRRLKGNTTDNDRFQTKYDASSGECRLEIHQVSSADMDTYKCFAANKYGKAVCTVTLTVTGGSSDGFDDLNLILKKMEEKKKERMLNMSKDGAVPYDDTEKLSWRSNDRTKDFSIKSLIQESLRGINQLDLEKLCRLNLGLSQDAEEVNLLLKEIKFSMMDFIVKIQETSVQEGEDALFECVLTHPLPSITWMGKGSALENGEKYSITVSDHKLIHRLTIKECTQQDKGIYSAVAGITSCSAWLVVEEDDTTGTTAKPLRTIVAGVAHTDLEKVAKDQQIKSQKEMERILEAVKARHQEGQVKWEKTFTSDGKDGGNVSVTGLIRNDGREHEDPEMARAAGRSEQTGSPEKVKTNRQSEDGMASNLESSWCVAPTDATDLINGQEKTQRTKTGRVDFDEIEGNVSLYPHQSESPTWKVKSQGKIRCSGDNEDVTESNDNSRGKLGRDRIIAGHNEKNDSNGNKLGSDHMDIQLHQISDSPRSTGVSESPSTHCNEYSVPQVKHLTSIEQSHEPKEGANVLDQLYYGENCPKEWSDCDKAVDGTAPHTRRIKQGPLIEDHVTDPGVHFIWGLIDVSAIINEKAELTCKLSSDDCDGAWFKDGQQISPDDNFITTQDGGIHKLTIIRCMEEHSGKYRFEADGRKTEATISVKDPPRFDPEDLTAFTQPVGVKVGHNAIFRLHFVGHEPIKIQWYREGEELQEDSNTKIEKSLSCSRLLLGRCQRKETGEIKIRLKNDHGVAEAISFLTVLDKPTSPLGPPEVTESSASCIRFRWRPPKDDGGSPVTNYIIERRQVGRNTWKKIGEIPGVPSFCDTDVDHGRKYTYRVQAVTAEGTSEAMETDEMQAGTLAFPGPPAAPKVVNASETCINLCWSAPSNTGRSRIQGYILEKRKKGSNLWTVVNASDETIKGKKHAVRDIVAGMEYEFRVAAVNLSGVGEFSGPSEFVFARDPKKPPGQVTGLKLTETSSTHLTLTWTTPKERAGIEDEAKGYFVEVRHADCIEWSRCNSSPITATSFSVRGLRSMEMYWVRVIASNDGGESAPQELSNYVIAMPSPLRPKFTNKKMKSFLVVRAGNAVRITVNFEASPQPDIMWVKDSLPVTKQTIITNCDGSSQMLIPSSERSDSGIYSVLLRNLVGQETFSTEVRVTDDPKPPGPVEVEENVLGTVTVVWEPSPDEKRDDRLHYTVTARDSTKRTWTTVADRLFNNRFTVCNIMHGRQYLFRVYAKNDIGVSAPSDAPTWGREKRREKFILTEPSRKECDLRCPPSFIVPLKLHTAPKGYECYMSCAVTGNPKPRITWFRNHISLNTNTNYYISNTCGVCSMSILHVGPKDMGEYSITAENSLGRAESSTILSVRE